MNFTLITNDINGQQTVTQLDYLSEVLETVQKLTRMGAPVGGHVVVDGFGRVVHFDGQGLVPAADRYQVQAWHKEARREAKDFSCDSF